MHGLSINTLIPNILTLLALCAGLTSVRFGLHAEWKAAVFSILLAGIFDGLDGRVARLLHGTSKFGAELDSLSDFVCFGVAPAMLLYFWTMKDGGGVGWALVLLFSVCMALRLARFNTALDKADQPAFAAHFFTGVPAPAAAGLALMPMIISFQFAPGNLFESPAVSSVVLIAVSFLMVSKIPTYSGKKLRVPHTYVVPVMLGVGLLAAFLASEPWLTISLIGIAYAVSIPLAVRSFTRLTREAEQDARTKAAGAEAPHPQSPRDSLDAPPVDKN